MHGAGPGLRLQTGLCMPYVLRLRVATTINYKHQVHVIWGGYQVKQEVWSVLRRSAHGQQCKQCCPVKALGYLPLDSKGRALLRASRKHVRVTKC